MIFHFLLKKAVRFSASVDDATSIAPGSSNTSFMSVTKNLNSPANFVLLSLKETPVWNIMLFQNIKNRSNEFSLCFTTSFTVYTVLSQYTITNKFCNKCHGYLHGCCILKPRLLTPHWMVLQTSCCYKPKPLITGKYVDLTSPLYRD